MQQHFRYLNIVVLLCMLRIIFTCPSPSKRNIFLQSRPHVAALILARGGSKGIKLKNLQTVSGQSLISRALEQVVQVDFGSIWVSTDNELIAEEAFKLNVHWRLPETATDQASSLLALQEFLNYHLEVDIVALIQCTSPFIHKIYLERSIKLIRDFECIFSVSRFSKLLWSGSSGNIFPINFNIKTRPRRQDFHKQYMENGMFYLATRKLIKSGFLQSNRCGIVEIPQYVDMEIDNYIDLLVANKLSELQI